MLTDEVKRLEELRVAEETHFDELRAAEIKRFDELHYAKVERFDALRAADLDRLDSLRMQVKLALKDGDEKKFHECQARLNNFKFEAYRRLGEWPG